MEVEGIMKRMQEKKRLGRERARGKERESERKERRKIKGRLPTHHRSAIFWFDRKI